VLFNSFQLVRLAVHPNLLECSGGYHIEQKGQANYMVEVSMGKYDI
jgi:hypothetical protein